MSQLIQMRQRIKAIQTIKKITSAMRLISRSLHTHLIRRRETLTVYEHTIRSLFGTIYNAQSSWHPERFFPLSNTPARHLFIIIGSQKGMCGTYNASLFNWIGKHQESLKQPNTYLLSIGKKITDHLDKYALKAFQTLYDIRPADLKTTTDSLLKTILHAEPSYTAVTVISNVSKSFFHHELKITQLLPLATQTLTAKEHLSEDYLWVHTPEAILDVLVHDYIKAQLEITLFESLVGEQAARFIAMDNATRNAKNFLSHMTLQYNKLRQAKITKELTELAGAFESQSFV